MEWLEDDRPSTLWTRVYVKGMWLARDKAAFEGEEHTRRTAVDKQRRGDRPPTAWTSLRGRVTTEHLPGITAWRVRPRRRTPVARVLYVHGGGYVHPLTRDYWRLVRALLRIPAEIIVPAYPLAPGHTVDEVLPLLLALEESTRSQVPTILMGDSAGGALVLVMATQMRDRGLHDVAGVVALCPWLDATLDEASVSELEASDPMLAESGLRAAGRWWAGVRDPADPLVSPVRADLSGLPPLDVWIGRRDILRPAVGDLAERARRAGADLTVHEVTAMFHVWMTRAIPEARRTRRALVELVRRRTDEADADS